MTNRRDYHAPTPHFDGKNEGPINSPVGPKMGIKIDIDPMKKQNPNPFHLKEDYKNGIEGFSHFFENNDSSK